MATRVKAIRATAPVMEACRGAVVYIVMVTGGGEAVADGEGVAGREESIPATPPLRGCNFRLAVILWGKLLQSVSAPISACGRAWCDAKIIHVDVLWYCMLQPARNARGVKKWRVRSR
jgi:hypothetical protein